LSTQTPVILKEGPCYTSGINRLTNNIALALPIIDDAFRYAVSARVPLLQNYIFSRVTDAEAVSMSRYLVQNDGFFLGSSSACNLVACVKLAKKMGWKDGETIVTIL
jgi:cysteine synthase A